MKIPPQFTSILNQNERLQSCIAQIVSDFQPILKDNKLYFFEEYTDHGIEHIESVLHAAAEIITDRTYSLLSAKDIAVLIMSIILHDLGMHIEYSTFLALLNGHYDDIQVQSLDKKKWKYLWEEYLNEAKRFSSTQRYLYFGNENQPFREPDLTNKDNLDGADKKLIGEFVRRFHTRFAHEVALKGLIGINGNLIEFGGNRLDDLYKKFAGIVARSHGMNIRTTFSYLREISGDAWKYPNQVNIVFLMVVLRIADYFQFHKDRVDSMLLKLKTFNSPVSRFEHEKHLAIEFVQAHVDDIERLYVHAKPNNSELFVRLNDLVKDIQYELDMSWAVLGEIYSKSLFDSQPRIKYRRITSNLEEELFITNLPYVPERISFETDAELPKLLIAPLYGDNPTFAVRELIQNAVDACLERTFSEKKMGNTYVPEILLKVCRLEDDSIEFSINDNGKGMSLSEIKNYFLRVGSSFRRSLDWKKTYTDGKGGALINRNGKFGIGILAAFLLGNTIEVKTKHFKDISGYSFKTSVDTEQIEVRIENHQVTDGTVIKVKIDDHTAKMLTKETNDFNNKIPKWTGWYLLEYPNITYDYFGELLSVKYIDPAPSNGWQSMQPKGFEKILWKYCDKLAPESNWQRERVICNGILIPTSPRKFITGSDVITELPALLITDNDGTLPLKLNRNELDGELPFSKELIRDLSRDFVAKLLLLHISPSMEISETKLRPNPANVIFLRDGYSLEIDYFLEALNNEGYRLIRFVTDKSRLNFTPDSLVDSAALIPSTVTKLSHSKLVEFIDPQKICKVTILKKRFSLLLNQNDKFANFIKRFSKVEFSNDELVVFKIGGEDLGLNVFDKFLTHDVEPIHSVIKDFSFDETLPRAGEILYEVLHRYIGENPVVPYSIEDRRQMYPDAFEELKEYMEKYLGPSF